MTDQQIEELLPAFEGIVTDDSDLVAVLRQDLPHGLVVLNGCEVEALARRILELQEIVRQNALVAE